VPAGSAGTSFFLAVVKVDSPFFTDMRIGTVPRESLGYVFDSKRLLP